MLIVGGGSLALQKLRGLAPTGAHVRVVAPRLRAELADVLPPGRLELAQRRFRVADLRGVALAFAATDDPAVNARVHAASRRRGIPVNAVDDPAHCTFYTPAVVRRGAVLVALSTAGGFPGLARALRETLEAWLPPAHEDALAGLYALRRALLASPLSPAERGGVLRALARRVAADYLTPAAAPPPCDLTPQMAQEQR